MPKIQHDWDRELPTSILERHHDLISRRRFLTRMATLSALAPGWSVSVLAQNRHDKTGDPVSPVLELEPWLTLSGIHDHLFPPTSDTPGAKDINATIYLKNQLERPDMDKEEREFIIKGVDWLGGMAQELKGTPFTRLSDADRETVLRRIAASRAGENWLSTLLTYLIEALLSDPVYGGNPRGIGWQWLEHQPGFPTPPATKMYWKLG